MRPRCARSEGWAGRGQDRSDEGRGREEGRTVGWEGVDGRVGLGCSEWEDPLGSNDGRTRLEEVDDGDNGGRSVGRREERTDNLKNDDDGLESDTCHSKGSLA